MTETTRRLAGLASAAATAALLAGQPAAASPAPAIEPSRTAASDPVSKLSGVSASSPSEAWAVGYYLNSASDQKNLYEHWNGTGWSKVPGPSPGTSNTLLGATSISADDAWAYGQYRIGSGNDTTIAVHWDGSTWSRVGTPSPGAYGGGLAAMSAVSGTDVWAVGKYSDAISGFQTLTLIEHWDGTRWVKVASPSPGRVSVSPNSTLSGVDAVSADDAWAVGSYNDSAGRDRSLIEHWDGTRWTHVPSPSPGVRANYLTSVSAVSADDVWAVGYYGAGPTKTLTLHWDGNAWTRVPSPNPDWANPSGSVLYGVSAVSATDAWAVGYFLKGNAQETLIEHWDGTSWTRTGPSGPGANDGLRAVAAASPTEVLTVGAYSSPVTRGQNRMLIQEWDGSAWRTY